MQRLDKIKDVKVAEQSVEVDPRSKTTADQANQDLNRAKLMQARELAEDKMDQNEELAKLRAGVSLAKTGVQQAAVITEDN